MIEQWKPIVGYEGLYEVSNIGRVRSMTIVQRMKNGVERSKNGKMLSQTEASDGYFVVDLSKDGRRRTLKVHRLVAETFCQNPLNLPVVNHKNENKHDNRSTNLEWCSIRYNLTVGTVQRRRAKTIGWKVRQYDSDGKYIQTFVTMRAASRVLKLPMSGIYNSVITQKQYKGFYFRKYEETKK